jgi:hypothetical protein
MRSNRDMTQNPSPVFVVNGDRTLAVSEPIARRHGTPRRHGGSTAASGGEHSIAGSMCKLLLVMRTRDQELVRIR